MSEAIRAVGSKSGAPCSPLTVEAVNHRVEALENKVQQQGTDLHSAVEEMKRLIGSPGIKADGSDATGLYDLAHSLNSRLKPFEKLYYEVRGAMKFGLPVVIASAAIIWWLAGDKVGRLLHG